MESFYFYKFILIIFCYFSKTINEIRTFEF
nr:MAG TPA: hypothetical protein [Caudoviricetes sp.]